jgi:hypothetical protein
MMPLFSQLVFCLSCFRKNLLPNFQKRTQTHVVFVLDLLDGSGEHYHYDVGRNGNVADVPAVAKNW